ncbi:MAG: N-acyl homoserine lactonase family protein [Candidatus Rokuibacteriota bacterium]
MSPIVIHRIDTGWIEAPLESTLLGRGIHPDLPGGRLVPYGYRERIERRDGSVGSGTMIPVPAWYVEGAAKRILVDTGVPPAAETDQLHERYVGVVAQEIRDDDALVKGLAALGVEPDQVDVLVHTHLHYDHIGRDELFEAAEVVVDERELSWALSPPPYASRLFYFPEVARHLRPVLDRVRSVRDGCEIAPGVRLRFSGGHSFGHSVIEVDTALGRVVLTGDAVYSYRSLEAGWPQGTYVDLEQSVAAIASLRRADVVVVNHDPLVGELFPTGRIGDEELSARTATYLEGLKLGAAPALDWGCQS